VTLIDADLASALQALQPQFAALRQTIHTRPELGYQEHETQALIIRELTSYGIEVHRGFAGTGVVGVLHGANPGRMVGLRADIDALPIVEQTGLDYASQNSGRMHACGHDGHTTMLLLAARHLAATRRFDGTVVFIFQPAEEGGAGAQRMIDDGLFTRFPCDAVYGMHNVPGLPLGSFGVKAGPMMAAGDRFNITISAKGGHGAMPNTTADPILAGAALVQNLQSLVARVRNPLDPAVLSVTMFHGGDAHNVIPAQVTIGGTARSFSAEARDMMEQGILRHAAAIADAYALQVEARYDRGYPATVNHPTQTQLVETALKQLVGEQQVVTTLDPMMGSEDFSYMLEAKPGSYLWVGNGDSAMLHTPKYNFNDEALVPGAAAWVAIIETELGDRG
jgi:amidohydrolase